MHYVVKCYNKLYVIHCYDIYKYFFVLKHASDFSIKKLLTDDEVSHDNHEDEYCD